MQCDYARMKSVGLKYFMNFMKHRCVDIGMHGWFVYPNRLQIFIAFLPSEHGVTHLSCLGIIDLGFESLSAE